MTTYSIPLTGLDGSHRTIIDAEGLSYWGPISNRPLRALWHRNGAYCKAVREGKNPQQIPRIEVRFHLSPKETGFKYKTLSFHRWLMIQKYGPPPKYWRYNKKKSQLIEKEMEVCHLDDNPLNNCYENMAWGTYDDNHGMKNRDKKEAIITKLRHMLDELQTLI